MRGALLLTLGFVTLALGGCLGAPKPEPAAAPSPEPEPEPLPDPPRRAAAPTPTPTTPPPSSGTPPPSPPPPAPDPGPLVVLAHIDTGINPYHAMFRDASALAQAHPSAYLPGYPADARRLDLTLGASSYQEAMVRDQQVWAKLEPGKLYWIPGTRIVGAVSLGPGGTACPGPLVTTSLPVPPVTGLVGPAPPCLDSPILDDHGHGTMTASRMAAREHSLCPACRIVSVEGPGAAAVQWAADQGWIDVQTNSWGTALPVPGGLAAGGSALRGAFASAAQRMAVFAASGNGVALQGGVGEPSYAQATGAAGVVYVGAHDNGRVTVYHGQPPHVLADGYGGWRANARDLQEFSASPESCCTSAASPYAAGGAAAVLLAARQILDHRGTGWRDGVGAAGNFTAPGGPLSDGKLTLDEFLQLVRATARPRPTEGPDDGLVHWAANPAAPPENATNPGQNPYCPGCWATPVDWNLVPEGAALYQLEGYGAIDPLSVGAALQVLLGQAALPDRTTEDTLFAADQQARAAVDALP